MRWNLGGPHLGEDRGDEIVGTAGVHAAAAAAARARNRNGGANPRAPPLEAPETEEMRGGFRSGAPERPGFDGVGGGAVGGGGEEGRRSGGHGAREKQAREGSGMATGMFSSLFFGLFSFFGWRTVASAATSARNRGVGPDFEERSAPAAPRGPCVFQKIIRGLIRYEPTTGHSSHLRREK